MTNNTTDNHPYTHIIQEIATNNMKKQATISFGEQAKYIPNNIPFRGAI